MPLRWPLGFLQDLPKRIVEALRRSARSSDPVELDIRDAPTDATDEWIDGTGRGSVQPIVETEDGDRSRRKRE
jgi:hypothetical protein